MDIAARGREAPPAARQRRALAIPLRRCLMRNPCNDNEYDHLLQSTLLHAKVLSHIDKLSSPGALMGRRGAAGTAVDTPIFFCVDTRCFCCVFKRDRDWKGYR